MKTKLKRFFIPQYSAEVYEKMFKGCDKAIQIGIFIIILAQVISSYLGLQYGNLIVTLLYAVLMSISMGYTSFFVRYCRCCLKNDINQRNFKESNNMYIFDIYEKISENIRDICISFLIALYSEKVFSVNMIITIILFVISSISVIRGIKSKKIANVLVVVMLILQLVIISNCVLRYWVITLAFLVGIIIIFAIKGFIPKKRSSR